MYQIQTDNKTILAERVGFVKKQANGVIISCDESEAMGIVSDTNEGFYQLAGREYLGDYEIVTIEKILPEMERLSDLLIMKTLEDDYQMTTLKLGLGIDI